MIISHRYPAKERLTCNESGKRIISIVLGLHELRRFPGPDLLGHLLPFQIS
jgi:hypothetical protein